MTDDPCLSSLELIQLRRGVGEPLLREHVRSCTRCSALLAALSPAAEEHYDELLDSLERVAPSLQLMIEKELLEAKQTTPSRAPTRRSGTRTRTVLLSQYLSEAIEAQDWDLNSLAERAQIPTSLLSGFCSDVFDLAHRRDTDAVANVLAILSDEPEEVARGPLWNSLLLTSEGMIQASGSPEMLAGSSFAGVSDTSREADLFRDQFEVDRSEPARRQAAELYLGDVLAAL